jgi:hypothetical protein
MTQQTILVGANPNDGNGDPLRDAMIKINANFTDLYSNYQTEAGLTANVITMTANNTSYVGLVSAANVVSNNQLSSNLSYYETTGSLLSRNYISGISGSGNVAYDATRLGGTSASGYQTTAGLASNVAILSANNAAYLGTVAAANYVQNSGAYTISGVYTHTANVVLNNNISLRLQTINATAYAGFRQQNDDNFVFYTTNTAYGDRAVFSIYANSITSNLNVSVPMQISSNLTVTSNTLTLGTSSVAANGYSYLPNGLLMQWGSLQVNSSTTAQTFPVSYGTNAYSVTSTGNTAAATYVPMVFSVTKTGFTIRTANTANTLCYWMAIGV